MFCSIVLLNLFQNKIIVNSISFWLLTFLKMFKSKRSFYILNFNKVRSGTKTLIPVIPWNCRIYRHGDAFRAWQTVRISSHFRYFSAQLRKVGKRPSPEKQASHVFRIGSLHSLEWNSLLWRSSSGSCISRCLSNWLFSLRRDKLFFQHRSWSLLWILTTFDSN